MTPLRYTPAGIEVLNLTVAHESNQDVLAGREGFSKRLVQVQMKAQALGSTAKQLQEIPMGEIIQLTGYLAPVKAGSKSLWLMVSKFSLS